MTVGKYAAAVILLALSYLTFTVSIFSSGLLGLVALLVTTADVLYALHLFGVRFPGARREYL